MRRNSRKVRGTGVVVKPGKRPQSQNHLHPYLLHLGFFLTCVEGQGSQKDLGASSVLWDPEV